MNSHLNPWKAVVVVAIYIAVCMTVLCLAAPDDGIGSADPFTSAGASASSQDGGQ